MSKPPHDAPELPPELDHSCAPPAPADKISKEAWGVVHEVQLLLQQAPDAPWSLEALGRRAGYDPHHLARLFQKVTGVSPLRYLRLLRLERAAHAIEHRTAASILEAGVDAAFESAEGFSRAFRRTFGVAPRRYPELIRARLREFVAPPAGLELDPVAETLDDVTAHSVVVPSFSPAAIERATALLHRQRPFDGPWQFGGVAQPWGWGPQRALHELRVLRFVEPRAPPPEPPLARWRLPRHDFYRFNYRGSLVDTGLACGWLMTAWMASKRQPPAYGPVIVVAETTEATTKARIYIPRRAG